MNFSEMLIQRRKSLCMSQEALAEKIQVSRQAVSKWETGEAMPDMAKLIALADALEMNLDELCGRSPAPQAAQQAAAPANRSFKRRSPVPWVISALLLLCSVVLLLNAAKTTPPAPAPLPDTISVSGVMFHNNGSGSLSYSFTPSVVGDGYTYEITFLETGSQGQTFEAPCVGGICSDTVFLRDFYFANNVSVVISNGEESRAVPVATDLNLFSANSASWIPVE